MRPPRRTPSPPTYPPQTPALWKRSPTGLQRSLSQPLSDLALPANTLALLRLAGVTTVADLLNLDWCDLPGDLSHEFKDATLEWAFGTAAAWPARHRKPRRKD